MAKVSGFTMRDDDYCYSYGNSAKRKPDEIEAWEVDKTEEKTNKTQNPYKTQNKKKMIDDSESSEDEKSYGSRPTTQDEDKEEVSEDMPAAIRAYVDFKEYYVEIVGDVFKEKVRDPSEDDWKIFVKEARSLATSSKIALDDEDIEFVMIHVICTIHAQKTGITKPRWEKIKDMKHFYQNGTFPKFNAASDNKRKKKKLEIEDSDDEAPEPEKNTYTFLQTYDICSMPLAELLQSHAKAGGVHGRFSEKSSLQVYDYESLTPFLLPALVEYAKELSNPRFQVSDDEPLRWYKHVFEEEDVLNQKIMMHSNPKDLKMKLKITNCEPGDENWLKQVRMEISKRCGLKFFELYPNKVKRDDQNRPIYTLNELANMRIAYQQVMKSLRL